MKLFRHLDQKESKPFKITWKMQVLIQNGIRFNKNPLREKEEQRIMALLSRTLREEVMALLLVRRRKSTWVKGSQSSQAAKLVRMGRRSPKVRIYNATEVTPTASWMENKMDQTRRCLTFTRIRQLDLVRPLRRTSLGAPALDSSRIHLWRTVVIANLMGMS